MEFHKFCLSRVCRLCRCILPNKTASIPPCRRSKPVADYRSKISHAFDIQTEDDQIDIHPQQICTKCIRKCDHAQNDEVRREKYLNEPKVIWKPHSRTSTCILCVKMQKAPAGGNKYNTCPAHLKRPLPFLLSNKNIFQRYDYELPEMQSRDIHDLAVKQELKNIYACGICSKIYEKPVYTTCHHGFCSTCLTTKFQSQRSTTIPCPNPTCNNKIQYHQVTALPHPVWAYYRHLELACHKCKESHPLHSGHKHTCVITSPTTASASTLVKLALQHEPNQPVPQPVEEAVGVWVGLMLSKKRMIELKSRPTAKKVSNIIYFTNF